MPAGFDAEETERKVLKEIDENALVNLLVQLVKIPSVTGEERFIAEYIAGWLETAGFDVELQKVREERYNVITKIQGLGGGLSLHLNGHMDTYPPSKDWINPYSGEVKNNKVYGLGSVDMKGGLCSMLMAAKAIKKSGVQLRGDVHITAIPGHLEGGTGPRHLLSEGFRADAGIVCEPTGLKVVVAHMASAYYELRTKGRPVLDTHKHLGVNAVQKMLKILKALEELEQKYQELKHPLLMSPLINIGTIQGGIRHNITADHCSVTFSVRYLPGQTPATVKDDIERLISNLQREDPELQAQLNYLKGWYDWPRYPLEVSQNEPIVKALVNAGRDITGKEPQVAGATYWTDAALFANAGIPTVVYGPGSEECYWLEESLPVEELVAAAKVYALVCLRLCGEDQGKPAAV